MAELNNLICVESGANTGFGDCFLNFGKIEGAFLVPSDFKLTAVQLADLQTSLTAAISAELPADRIYPIHGFEAVTDATEDKVIETLGYGGKYPVREGDYDWTFRFLRGGFCLLKSLRAFNGSGKSVIFYDANGVLIGVKDGEDLKGIPLVFFWSNPWRASDGTASANYAVQFVFKPRYINDDLGFVKADFNYGLLLGLQNVNLAETATSARPVLDVTAKAGCSGFNLFETYETELAAVGAWTVTQGGAAVAITSVAANQTNQSWTITVDTLDANYSATEPMVVSLVGVTALGVLGVTGFESKKLIIPV